MNAIQIQSAAILEGDELSKLYEEVTQAEVTACVEAAVVRMLTMYGISRERYDAAKARKIQHDQPTYWSSETPAQCLPMTRSEAMRRAAAQY